MNAVANNGSASVIQSSTAAVRIPTISTCSRGQPAASDAQASPGETPKSRTVASGRRRLSGSGELNEDRSSRRIRPIVASTGGVRQPVELYGTADSA